MPPAYPPTIIVVHPKERRSKCTVEPLRGIPGFVFWKFPNTGPELLEDYVQLGFNGSELSRDDADRGLLVLDATWRFAATMEGDFINVPVRSFPPWKTAYPRVSKMFENPLSGLATIEAIYVAYKLLDRATDTLLDDYHWRDEFLSLNQDRLED